MHETMHLYIYMHRRYCQYDGSGIMDPSEYMRFIMMHVGLCHKCLVIFGKKYTRGREIHLSN